MLLSFGLLAGMAAPVAAQDAANLTRKERREFKKEERKAKAELKAQMQEMLEQERIEAVADAVKNQRFVFSMDGYLDKPPFREAVLLWIYPHKFRSFAYLVDTKDYSYQWEEVKEGWKVTIEIKTNKSYSNGVNVRYELTIPPNGYDCVARVQVKLNQPVLYSGHIEFLDSPLQQK